jgi:phage terminase large subunit GpA-like protein
MSLTSTEQWLDQVWREAIAPEARLTVSQWADAHRMLPVTSAPPAAPQKAPFFSLRAPVRTKHRPKTPEIDL